MWNFSWHEQKFLFIFSFFIFCLLDFVLSSVVIQQSVNPLIKHEGEEARLDCYHGDNDYPYMFWYQHKSLAGQRAMELIGKLHYENSNLEENFDARFNITGHSKRRAQLVISNIKLTDSAEYFCAASKHSASIPLAPLTKSWWLTASNRHLHQNFYTWELKVCLHTVSVCALRG